ncbi:hypothetical protein Vretimale_8718 [Volvox reticuliferus]|uniref:Protein kinase domain-containing protein n=1 Tax=Volvox reticuliferus TaxID=1737510 RepID=A0A8J4GBC1_9CHLO|nr:hypothetical protein Vretimale_8718 [Volvox reticuliferus]
MDGTLGQSGVKELPEKRIHLNGSFRCDVTDVAPANRCLESLSVAHQPAQPAVHGSLAAVIDISVQNPFKLAEAILVRRRVPSSLEPLRQQHRQQHRQQQQRHRQVPKRAAWIRSLQPVPVLLILYFFAVAQFAAAKPSISVQSAARRLLQDEQQPSVLPPPPPPSTSQQLALSVPPQTDISQTDQPQLPKQPASPPPPPSSIATASTSEEFFRLLYSESDITEIRLVRDIKLLASDAIAAANELADTDTDAEAGSVSSEAEAAATASAALGMGTIRGPLLRRNLSIVGYRGTHTRLDTNFLSAIIRLEGGVRLTLRKVELYKALNQLGQALDIIGKSNGGVVELHDCVQRRAACVPFNLAVAQILSLPPAVDLQLRNRTPDLSLRNDSAFCWSTSTLLATCKQPSIDVQSVAVHVAIQDGVLRDNGGYDVSYTDSHIVCDYQVEPNCLQFISAEQCLAQELVQRFGSDMMELPPLEPAVAAAPVIAGQQGPSAYQGEAAGGQVNTGSRRMVVGMVAGLAGGGGCAVLLFILLAGVLVIRRRQQRRRDVATGPDRKDGVVAGGSGNHDGTAAAAAAALGTSGSTVVQYPEAGALAAAGAEAETSKARRESAAGCSAFCDRADGGGGGGGISCSSQEVSIGTHDAAVLVAETASDRGRLDIMDVEAIRRSLFSASRRYPEVPLQVQVLSLLGEGSFGKVYRAMWHGTVVALKALVLPGTLMQDQRRRQMAVMEAAISSAMSHPNIVQTYTYSFRPIRDTATPDRSEVVAGRAAAGSGGAGGSCSGVSAAGPGGGGGGGPNAAPAAAEASSSCAGAASGVHGCELMLVLEYCDRGSLRQALDAGVFHRHSGSGGGAGPCGVAQPATMAAVGAEEPVTTPPLTDHLAAAAAGVGVGVAAETCLLAPTAKYSTLTMPPPSPRPRASTPAAAAAAANQVREVVLPFVQLQRPEGQLLYNYGLMLQVASDVAAALLHLHSHGVVHGDVKASNVLLKTGAQEDQSCLMAEAAAARTSVSGSGSGAAGTASPASLASPPLATAYNSSSSPWSRGGLVAKIADFGLSTVMGMEGDAERTHITAITAQGSLTHMAPELMLHGHISKRVDVYAFGILMYELFTGDRAHRGVPRALLPHQVCVFVCVCMRVHIGVYICACRAHKGSVECTRSGKRKCKGKIRMGLTDSPSTDFRSSKGELRQAATPFV